MICELLFSWDLVPIEWITREIVKHFQQQLALADGFKGAMPYFYQPIGAVE